MLRKRLFSYTVTDLTFYPPSPNLSVPITKKCSPMIPKNKYSLSDERGVTYRVFSENGSLSYRENF